MSAPTVAIIGLGFGRAHIPAFQAHGCRVVALCQRDQAAARKIADTYGVPEVFARWEETLDRARPDVVVIATPPHLHHDIALAAIARGAHVLCEKPVAMTEAQALAMVDAAGFRPEIRSADRRAITFIPARGCNPSLRLRPSVTLPPGWLRVRDTVP